MADAPFFFLVQVFATADALDFLASDEVHYEAGETPDATKAAEQAGQFFCAEPHHLEEDEIEAGIVKVYGPFYKTNPLETTLALTDDGEWESVS